MHQRARRVRRALASAVAVAVATGAACAAPAAATTAESSFVATRDCQEHQAFVQGDQGAVTARLPKRYTPLTDPASGAPVIFVRALKCMALTLDGRSAPITAANYGIVINSPDGSGCASAAPAIGSTYGNFPPVCNWYPLAWLSSDERVTRWLRQDTPDFPAYTVPGLVFKLGQFDLLQGGQPLHVEAPAPSPSPFSIDEMGRPRPGTLAVRGNYWRDTSDGTVRLRFSTEDITSGDASGTVRAAARSELAYVMGATGRPYLAAYSGVSAEHWDHAAYRKQIESAADAGSGFSGSCSVTGSVAFNPPATNASVDLTYDYNGAASCDGTLDGHHVTGATAKVRHAGPAYGGCQEAYTTAPGVGSLAFASGTVVPYTLDFHFHGTEGDFELYGLRAGKAAGHGSFANQEADPNISQQCGGDGVKTAALDWSFSTQTPLITTARVQPPPRATPPSPPARPTAAPRQPKLRLSIRPRRVRAGRRMTFRVRVVNAEGRAVPRAKVRLAGRRVYTRADGRGALNVALRRQGRAVVLASEPGFRPARATVVVDAAAVAGHKLPARRHHVSRS